MWWLHVFTCLFSCFAVFSLFLFFRWKCTSGVGAVSFCPRLLWTDVFHRASELDQAQFLDQWWQPLHCSTVLPHGLMNRLTSTGVCFLGSSGLFCPSSSGVLCRSSCLAVEAPLMGLCCSIRRLSLVWLPFERISIRRNTSTGICPCSLLPGRV